MMHNAPIFVCVLLVIAIVNILNVERRQRKNRRMEAERLRIGLKAEMEELAALLDESLETIKAGGQMASTRGAEVFFKGNVQRLVTLLDSEIELIVRAYVSFECNDRAIAAVARPLGGFAYKLGAEVPTAPLEERMQTSRKHLLAAIAAMQASLKSS